MPLRILLVEDNPINQDLARRRLQKLGHTVSLAEDGHKAVEVVQKRSFDCILMDIQMPGMDGFEATRIIRDWEAESGLTPLYIIAMTAHAMKGDRERCLESGMDNYIPKPFRVEILKEVLDQASRATSQEPHVVTTSDARGGDFAIRLQKMAPEDREDVLAAAPIFLEAFPKDVLRLKNLVSSDEFKECYFIAHTMKGVVGIFGCEECILLAEKLEAAAQSNDKEALEESAEALIEAMGVLAREVEFSAI